MDVLAWAISLCIGLWRLAREGQPKQKETLIWSLTVEEKRAEKT